MAPGVNSTKVNGGWTTTSRLTGPLKYSGSLEEYEYVDSNPILGSEFPTLQLSEILNDDRKVRDLAILGERRTSAVPVRVELLTPWTVSQRNVVFFRNQDLTVEEQKILAQKLGELTGKPESSGVCGPCYASESGDDLIDG